MKQIKINYINKNKNKFKRTKLAFLGAALCLLTSCSAIHKQPQKDNYTNEISSTEFFEEPDILEVESLVEASESLKEEDIFGKEVDISNISLSDKYVSTYNTDFEISSELQSKINGYIDGFGSDCAFIAINLKDGMSFGYNIDESFQTASTIKVAVSLYAFKEMDKGNGSLDELKVYEERFRRDGSGILKNKESGTSYSLNDLFYYTLHLSDNVAYYMIHDRFYNEGYNEFLKELGCTELYLNYGAKWGRIDARSMALVWQEIYKYKDQTENGKILFELLTNADYNYIKEGMEHYDSAHKSGWTPNVVNDSGIVFASDDYIVVTLNKNNGNYSAKSQLLKICSCIEKVIDEYTLYKNNNNEKTTIK